MNTINQKTADELNLKNILKHLCSTQIRHPMTNEQVRAWLNQFESGPEKILGLLILRFLIYRTSSQLCSSLKQAFKLAALHFIPDGCVPERTDWKDILTGESGNLDFYYGPPKNEYMQPGKSGEIISRLIKHCIPMQNTQLNYPDSVGTLSQHQRFLLIDDASYTGQQLMDFIQYTANFMANGNQSGIVVGLAHDEAIKALSQKYKNLPIFYGERITPKVCFEETSAMWVDDGLWPFTEITPLELYVQIVTNKAKFEKSFPLGYGNLGCMIAYEHGIPDDSLQLLWGESATWKPLFKR